MAYDYRCTFLTKRYYPSGPFFLRLASAWTYITYPDQGFASFISESELYQQRNDKKKLEFFISD